MSVKFVESVARPAMPSGCITKLIISLMLNIEGLNFCFWIFERIDQLVSFVNSKQVMLFMHFIFYFLLDLDAVLNGMISQTYGEGNLVKFSCNTCGKMMSEKRDMKRHVESHLNMTYSCEICQKTCNTSNALRKHFYMHHRS